MTIELLACADSRGESKNPSPDSNATALAKYAYVMNQGSNSITQYKVDKLGRLSNLPTVSIATGEMPTFTWFTQEPT